ncbi:DUF339-domain-containing protein [Ascobolus immersus RN42]|uniref:Succinate dehydrogenase assembly factor 2, mitochondrial n=1 Tax=Ascobolus immersus RN42 TaxID=1160509 RepID=A0A3N4IKN1_ASCIM|nr:DUF339-domain-containing protein [Ascobolus immersus RN42]
MLSRALLRSARLAGTSARSFSSAPSVLSASESGSSVGSGHRSGNERQATPNTEYAKQQTSKPINPRIDQQQHTQNDVLPKSGVHNAPPEFLSSTDPKWAKKVGGASLKPSSDPKHQDPKDQEHVFDLKIDPIERTGETLDKMRARLLYQSRKRGILETDLLLSTFAEQNLPQLNEKQLQEYDKFLDEADWDIYYWCTQEAPPTSQEYAEGAAEGVAANATAAGKAPKGEKEYGVEEWAQTVGKAKVPYKEIPQKWKDSEILGMLRQHVENKKGEAGGGLGRMPSL